MKMISKTFSRRISETWSRFLEEDYLAIPIPSEKIREIDFENVDATIGNSLKIDEEAKRVLSNAVKSSLTYPESVEA